MPRTGIAAVPTTQTAEMKSFLEALKRQVAAGVQVTAEQRALFLQQLADLREAITESTAASIAELEAEIEALDLLLSAEIAALEAAFLARLAPDVGMAVTLIENRTYIIDRNASFAYDIETITSICASGTCTATVRINGVAVTATANSVSSSEQVRTPTGNNSVAIGDDVTIEITSNSSCQYAFIKCKASYS